MPKTKTLYSVHPSVQMVQNWIATLKEKSGRSVEEWLALIRKSGPDTGAARREWLKTEYDLGTNTASWLADRAEGKNAEEDSPEAYLRAAGEWVEAMYGGKKHALRPLYEKLLDLGLGLANDVKACPCRTMLPLYRKHVFAQIKPSTNTRIDMGFALGSRKATGRLIDTGGYAKKDRITHRMPITSPEEIDAEVLRWLRTAYEADV